MNQTATLLPLAEFMTAPDGWGRAQGREVYPKLLDFVETVPGALVLQVSFKGVRRIDISFASETVVELAARYKAKKGICLIDVTDTDVLENIDAAAVRKGMPLTVWTGSRPKVLGLSPSQGNEAALNFALSKAKIKAAELASAVGVSVTNASTKLKQLWDQGFLLRREEPAESGGIEYSYYRIG